MGKVTAENVSVEHVKAARDLLGWSSTRLSELSGLNAASVRRFESGGRAGEASRRAIFDTLGYAGITFQNGGKPGVQFQLPHSEL